MLVVGKEFTVLVDVFSPFCGNREFVEYGIDRAYRLAVSTIYARHRVYEKHFVIIGGVYAVNWTHSHASGVFHFEAGFGDDKRHALP